MDNFLKLFQDACKTSSTWHRHVNSAEEYLKYTISNETFQIAVSYGSKYRSIPESVFDDLKDYEKVCVEVSDYIKPPSPEELEMKPLVVEHEGKSYSFNFNVHFYPYQSIDLMSDSRFTNQNWELMPAPKQISLPYGCLVSPTTLADIIRYCSRISNMKAFW